jgi:hypothetical protein
MNAPAAPYRRYRDRNRGQAVIFIDLEHALEGLKDGLGPGWDPIDLAIGMIRRLRESILASHDADGIILRGFADLEKLESSSLGPLHLAGVDVQHVMSHGGQSGAAMRTALEALETLHTRPDIGVFVVLAGGPEYIPLIQHLRRSGRRVIAAGFAKRTSGDLIANAGRSSFIDCAGLMGEAVREQLRPSKPETASAPAELPAALQSERFAEPKALADSLTIEALEILVDSYGDKPEVWVSPYLHKLRAELPHLDEEERKDIITDLRESGAIAVEKRRGEPHDYSVIFINWAHPSVQKAAGREANQD